MPENTDTIPQQLQLDDGRTLCYAEYGDPVGKAVFFFHGAPSSRLIHPDERITASRGVRLISIDRPGFGRSSFQPRRRFLDWPTDVETLADRLGIERFSVVGISGGSAYVAACAYKIPERLNAAGIVSGMGCIDTTEGIKELPPDRAAAFRLARMAPWLARPLAWLFANPGHNPERFLKMAFALAPDSDQEILSDVQVREMFISSYAESTRQGVRGLAWEARLYARDWGFRLEEIPMKVHLWHGEEDTATPPSMARKMAEKIPDCEARFFPGEGHLLLFKNWEEILNSLIE